MPKEIVNSALKELNDELNSTVLLMPPTTKRPPEGIILGEIPEEYRQLSTLLCLWNQKKREFLSRYPENEKSEDFSEEAFNEGIKLQWRGEYLQSLLFSLLNDRYPHPRSFKMYISEDWEVGYVPSDSAEAQLDTLTRLVHKLFR